MCAVRAPAPTAPGWHPTTANMWMRPMSRTGDAETRSSRMDRFAATAVRVLGRTLAPTADASNETPMNAFGSAACESPQPIGSGARSKQKANQALWGSGQTESTRGGRARAWVGGWLLRGLHWKPLAVATRTWADSMRDMRCLLNRPEHPDGFCSWPRKYTGRLTRNAVNQRRALAFSRREFNLQGPGAAGQDVTLLGPGRWDQ